MNPIPNSTQFSIHGAHYNPVLRACELLGDCMHGDNDMHGACKPEMMDLSAKANSLPRRLLDLSHDHEVLTFDVQTWIATARATVEELSNYCTLSYRWGNKPPNCMLKTQLTGKRVKYSANMPQTFKDAIVVARGLKIHFL
jgi:hypothetical protein